MGEIRLPPLFLLCPSLSLLLALHSSGLVWFLFGLLLIPYSLVTCLFVYILLDGELDMFLAILVAKILFFSVSISILT